MISNAACLRKSAIWRDWKERANHEGFSWPRPQGMMVGGGATLAMGALCLTLFIVYMITAIGYIFCGVGALGVGYGFFKIMRGER